MYGAPRPPAAGGVVGVLLVGLLVVGLLVLVGGLPPLSHEPPLSLQPSRLAGRLFKPPQMPIFARRIDT